MYITRLHRCQATIALVSSAIIAAGCADDGITGPAAPEGEAGSRAFSSATIENGATPSTEERAAGEEIARSVALALADPALRQEIKLAFASSGNREGKLDFTSFIQGRGANLRAGIASRTGESSESFANRVARVRRLEFYMPVGSHREAWSGGENILVGIALRQAETPVAFDIHGKRFVLDRNRAPAQPTIMLDQVETDFRRQIPENAAGRALVPCSAASTLGSLSLSAAMKQCSDRGASSVPQLRKSLNSAPNDQGFYASYFRLMDAHEPWFMGDPELEIHAIAKEMRSDLSARAVQCIGQHASTAEYQPGIRSTQYEYDQNGDFWDELVLLLSPKQLDLATQSEPDGFNLSIWEDDDEACKIKQKSTEDYFKQAVVAAGGIVNGWVALLRREWGVAVASFGMAAADLYALFRGDDDYVGLLVAKANTPWANEYPENNYIVLDQDAFFAGRATLELLTGTPTTLPVTSVLVSPHQPDFRPTGTSFTMQARGYDVNGRVANVSSISWSSSNPSVATVSPAGVVSTVAPGTSTITATLDGVAASTTATVYGPVAWVTVTPGYSAINVYQGVNLRARGYDSNGTEVPNPSITWFSQDPGIATVDNNGIVIGHTDGSAVIQATIDGVSGHARVDVGTPPPCGPTQC